jgi:GNAT superfamily N-acetyltransferase
VTAPSAAARRLADLLAATLPDEALSPDELHATLVEDPDGEVLLSPDGAGAVGVAVRGDAGYVTVVVVHPDAQRRGAGRRLLDDAHAWLRDRGATSVRTGASAPRYLWPGVDVDAHPGALRLFAGAGYEPVAATHNMRCPTSYRAPAPEGYVVRRAHAGTPDADALLAFAAAAFPAWVDELGRALATGCCHGAFAAAAGAAPAGFGCHSVNRAGWVGPMATDPAVQGRGVGSALLAAVCRDLALAELDEAEIAWVGPAVFYEKAGARTSRRFTVLGRPLTR